MQQHETSGGRVLVSRRGLAMITALLALGFGVAIVLGALEYSVGWDERGPEPGYFPFWMGLVVIAGATGALLEAVFSHNHTAEAAITVDQARRMAAFLLPIVGFLILAVALKLGLYVGMVAYLFTVMLWQGGYRLPATAAVSFGTAAFFFLMFEHWLKVSLMKGPIEAWLGIH